jgi:MFS family permease
LSDSVAKGGSAPARPGLIPPLGRRAWWPLVGYALANLGNGLAWPYLIVYLSKVRGIELSAAGLVLSVISFAGVLSVPVVGGLVDRVGARRSVLLSLVVATLGMAWFANVHVAWQAYAAGFLFGAGNVGAWNALATLLAVSVPPSQRGAVFGVSFLLSNLAQGIGGIVSGSIVNLEQAGTFVFVLLAYAASLVAFGVVVAVSGGLRRAAAAEAGGSGAGGTDLGPAAAEAAAAQAEPAPVKGGWRAALADRGLVGAALVNACFAFTTAGLLDATFPVWATGPAGAPARVIGLGFSAAVLSIGIGQLFVLRYVLPGRRRSRALSLSSLICAAGVLLLFAAGTLGGGLSTSVGLIAAVAIYGFAGTLYQPSLYGMVNDIAPDALRGRYNSVINFAWQAGCILGPAAAGFMLGLGRFGTWFGVMVAVCVVGALCALRLERIVPPSVNMTPAAGQEPPPSG